MTAPLTGIANELLNQACIGWRSKTRAEFDQMIRDVIAEAKAEERDACAAVAEDRRFANAPAWERPRLIAHWIRQRGEK